MLTLDHPRSGARDPGAGARQVRPNLAEKGFRLKKFDARKFTAQHDRCWRYESIRVVIYTASKFYLGSPPSVIMYLTRPCCRVHTHHTTETRTDSLGERSQAHSLLCPSTLGSKHVQDLSTRWSTKGSLPQNFRVTWPNLHRISQS